MRSSINRIRRRELLPAQ